MPKTMCPLCGAKTHVNTGDPAAFERRYPELLVVGYAGRLCPTCEAVIVEGDSVVIRDSESEVGRVARVADCADGYKLYAVEFPSGMVVTYPRNRLRKLTT